MGRKDIEMAKLYTKATFFIDFFFLFILLCPMAIFGNDLIPFLSKDRIVLKELHQLLYLLILLIALDGNIIFLFRYLSYNIRASSSNREGEKCIYNIFIMLFSFWINNWISCWI